MSPESGEMVRCESGRTYEIVRREEQVQTNYGKLGGDLGDGWFVFISAPTTCRSCHKSSPNSGAEPGRIGWMSQETMARSVTINLPECPRVCDVAL